MRGEPKKKLLIFWVGGNTKVFGAALVRLRERDFEAVEHKGGISPAWCLSYQDFEPYYTRAEQLYQDSLIFLGRSIWRELLAP